MFLVENNLLLSDCAPKSATAVPLDLWQFSDLNPWLPWYNYYLYPVIMLLLGAINEWQCNIRAVQWRI